MRLTSPAENPMSPLFEVRHVTVSIARPPASVYAFLCKVENIPQWASGLAGSVKELNGEWVAEGPAGPATIRFARENDFGVLDHDVVLPSGDTVHNPMRVVPNGTGSEVTFTLFRRAGVSQDQFETDARWVEKDLRGLKAFLER